MCPCILPAIRSSPHPLTENRSTDLTPRASASEPQATQEPSASEASKPEQLEIVLIPTVQERIEQQPAREEPESHSIAAIPKREEMLRKSPMRPDLRKSVGRPRKESFPRVLDLNLFQRRQQRIIVLAQLSPARRERALPS